MSIISFIKAKSLMRGVTVANRDRVPQSAQNPEIKGLRALQGVTYVSVSDKNGRMDDDMFDLLLEEEAPTRSSGTTKRKISLWLVLPELDMSSPLS
jgi:hypothetical protein